MALKIGELYAALTLDDKKFTEGIKTAEGATETFSQKMSRVGKAATTYVTGPLAAAGTGVLAFAKAQGAWAEQLGNLNASTGLSVKRLQEMKYVADISGISFDGLTNSSLLLQRKLMGIEEGSGPAADAMKQLGIQTRDSSGQLKSMDTLLPQVLASLQNMENPTERNAIASQLFGRSLQDIAPYLSISKAEMDKMTDAAQKSGHVLGDETVKKLQDFDDKLFTVQATVSGFAIKALDAFMALPAPVQKATLVFLALAAAAGPLMQLVGAINAIKNSTILAGIAARLTGVSFAGMWAAITGPVGIVIAIIALIAGAVYLIYKNWDKVKAFFLKLWAATKKIFVAAWEAIKAYFTTYSPAALIYNNWGKIVGFFDKIWSAVYDNTIGRLTKMFGWIWDQIKKFGKWIGIGGDVSGPNAPTPKSATTASAEAAKSRDKDIVNELKGIRSNTEKRAYA